MSKTRKLVILGLSMLMIPLWVFVGQIFGNQPEGVLIDTEVSKKGTFYVYQTTEDYIDFHNIKVYSKSGFTYKLETEFNLSEKEYIELLHLISKKNKKLKK